MKVSVIVPVYNVEQFLPECLDSLKAQTLKEIEIICVNDGSPDNSLEILNRYAVEDERFVIVSQENGGLSAARNTGLKYATGDYVYFLDSDDLISPQYLETMYNQAVKEDADIVFNENFIPFTGAVPADVATGERGTYPDGIYRVLPEYILKRHNNVQVWTKLYKRTLITENNLSFPMGLIYEDEYFYFTTMPFAKTVVQCNTGMYYYRQTGGSIIAKAKSQKRCYDIFKIFELIYNFYQEHGFIGKFYLPYELLRYRSSQVADYKEFRSLALELVDRLNLDVEIAKKSLPFKLLYISPNLLLYRLNKTLFTLFVNKT